MPNRDYVALRRKKARLTRSVVAALTGDSTGEDIKGRIDELEAVDAMLSAMRRGAAFVWAVRGVMVLLVLMLVLSRVSMPSAAVNISTTARAITIDMGATSENVLAGLPTLTRAQTVSRDGEQCFAADASSDGCVPVETLRLNAVTVYGHAVLAIQEQNGCATLAIEKGGGDVLMTFRRHASSPAGSAEGDVNGAVNGVKWETAHAGLRSGDTFTLCPQRNAEFRVPQPSRVLIGHRIALGPADIVVTPALLEGTLSIGETGRSAPLGRSDVVSLGAIQGGAVMIDAAAALSLVVVGRVSSGSVSSGTGTPGARLVPTWLEYLWHSPTVRSLVGLISAVIAFVVSSRDRILAEFGG